MTTVYPTSTHGVHGNSGDKSAGKDVFPSGKGRKCLEISGDRYSGFLWERADYGRRYFPNGRIILVTGHTPTPLIRADRKPLIFQENGHIAHDYGCVFGGNLAAYCIETGECFYVKKQ